MKAKRGKLHVIPIGPFKEAFANYLNGLESAAEEYKKAKAAGRPIKMAASAMGSVLATTTFLREVGAPGHITAPLLETQELITKAVVPARISRKFDAVPHHQYEKVIQAVAVWFLIQCGMDEGGACRRALGKNEPQAISALKNFRGKLTQKKTPYPREKNMHSKLIAENKDLAPKAAAEKFLRHCKHLRGQRSW